MYLVRFPFLDKKFQKTLGASLHCFALIQTPSLHLWFPMVLGRALSHTAFVKLLVCSCTKPAAVNVVFDPNKMPGLLMSSVYIKGQIRYCNLGLESHFQCEK